MEALTSSMMILLLVQFFTPHSAFAYLIRTKESWNETFESNKSVSKNAGQFQNLYDVNEANSEIKMVHLERLNTPGAIGPGIVQVNPNRASYKIISNQNGVITAINQNSPSQINLLTLGQDFFYDCGIEGNHLYVGSGTIERG